jgi:hypothetical protein
MNELLKLLRKKYPDWHIEILQDQKWNGLVYDPIFTTYFSFMYMDQQFSIKIKFNKRIKDSDGAEIEWYLNEVSRRFNNYRDNMKDKNNGEQARSN